MAQKKIKGAIIEIGTNSVKFLVGSITGINKVETYQYRREITRLGEGLFRTGRLSGAPMERTIKTIKKYQEMARDARCSEVLIFGTHALRTAENADDFLDRLRKETGLDIEVMSSLEEAFMTRNGVLLELPKRVGTEPVIIDIGGGSTEIIHGIWARSLPVGCVNLTENYLEGDPPNIDDLARISSRVRELLLANVTFINPGQRHSCVGVGGTINAYAALLLGLEEFNPERIHGFSISPETLKSCIEKLSSIPLAERRKIMKFDPDRADVIIAGMTILHAFFKFIMVDGFSVSINNIIHGKFYDHFSKEFLSRCK